MTKRLGRRKGQTTVEYGIIVALIAIASIAIVLIFGDQIRALFAAETEQLSGDQTAVTEDKASDITDEDISGSLSEF